MATAVKFVHSIAIFLPYLIQLDVDVTGNITAKLCEVGSEFNIFCTLVTMATTAILNLFNPPTAATHYSGYSYKVSWSLFPWQLRQSLSNRFRFFGLFRSTSCGCCSYQVSSISVWRVTCYDHFCVFQFFSILAVSMATATILKKINPYQHNFTWHMIFLQGFIKFDQGISEKSSGEKCVEE